MNGDKMGHLLEEKVCLVTGAARGIGREITKTFLDEGAIVFANVRQENVLENMISEYNSEESVRLIPIVFDITDKQAVRDAIMKIKKQYCKLDVLVNNAGIVTNEVLGMISIDKMRQMFEVNVFGMMELTQMAVTRLMKKQKGGSIINITSMVGVDGCKGQIAYSASKGAIISVTKSMSKELSADNIRVNAVAPGIIETDRIKNTISNIYNERIPDIGMGRLGKPKDISDACLFFASDMSKYTTGQILGVHGDISL